MANRHRGEISATLDGREWQLCLTLGALAELENRMGVDDIAGLAHHFGSGKLSSRDVIAIITFALKGGGHDVEEEEVRQMHCPGGIAGFARIVSQLLEATFGQGDSREDDPVTGDLPVNPT